MGEIAALAFAKHRAALHACTACPLNLTSTKALPSTDSSNEVGCVALVDRPTDIEAAAGRAFTGPAAKFFKAVWREVGGEGVVMGVNVIACAPDAGKPPSPGQEHSCSVHAKHGVALGMRMGATVGVVLGAQALQAIRPDLRVTLHHGNAVTWQGMPFVVTHHPSAVLRDKGLLGEWKQDLAWAARVGKHGVVEARELWKSCAKCRVVKAETWDVHGVGWCFACSSAGVDDAQHQIARRRRIAMVEIEKWRQGELTFGSDEEKVEGA